MTGVVDWVVEAWLSCHLLGNKKDVIERHLNFVFGTSTRSKEKLPLIFFKS